MRYVLNKTKYLDDDELRHLEYVLRSHVDRSTRDCLMLLTLLHTGARASEALAIEKKDLSNGTVLIRGLKGSDDREVPLPQDLYRRLCSFAPDTGRLFPITYKRLFQVWEIYRPCRKKLHSLRHTFAITQLRKHGRIDVIRKLLGHRSIANTMIYADYAYTQAEFRKLVV